jgi:EmrB/QacA subfamily drug resistance transporter
MKATSMSTDLTGRRWLALYILCLGVLMIVLDTTIVNVALPSIREGLGFSESSLAWVVNAYVLTFGGLLLLGGRLGDLYGHRRLFLAGLTVFVLASLACGVAQSQSMLIVARAVQGAGGAVVSAVALSLIMMMFTQPAERATAMGVYGFVCAAGGSVGVLVGGFLTDVLNWRWTFLVNLPVGIAVFVLCAMLLPEVADGAEETPAHSRHLDVGGAATITAAMMLAVYAIVNGNEAGWTSLHTMGLLAVAVAAFAAFIAIERRVAAPLVPLGLFRLRSIRAANMVGVLWAAAMFAWFFLCALYLQLVLAYSPLQLRMPVVTGMLLVAGGLALFARVPLEGSFAVDVLPAMILLGLGAGTALNPVLLAAMGEVDPGDAGLASGVVNTSFMMGGALGLAVLASLASSRTLDLLAHGHAQRAALLGGYQWAFMVGAAFAFTASLLAARLLGGLSANTAVESTAA